MTVRETTYKGKLGEWERLMAMVAANNGDLGHLTVMRERLASLLTQAQDVASRQAVHTAAKQEASQDLRSVIVEGDRIATLLRGMVKQHYGIGSEKLAEFGVQPFRGRTRKKPEGPPPPPVEDAPPASGEPSR